MEKSIKITGQLRALAQLKIVARIAESKYQCEKGYRLYYVLASVVVMGYMQMMYKDEPKTWWETSYNA